ncbi:MAG: hypothetical protein AB7I59_00510 [Geminicoccaceae bacterium]
MSVLAPGCGPNAPIVAGKDARAGTYQTKPTGKALHSFTLHNTSTTATTRAAARLGLAFLKGDVPKGKKLAVWVKGGRRVPFSAAAATNTWADGSLRSTADGGMVMLDGSLGPGQSRTYEVYAANGTAPTSGFDPFAWLAAHGNDLTVSVTSRTGSATGAKPDLLFSLKTAIATTTRREILCDTGRFVRIKAWQKVPQEEHLICEYHVDFWLDEAGAPFGLEFAPVLSQHWWVADPFGQTQTKERYTYDVVVKYGTTVLDSRSRLDHAYHCRWASLRPQDDAQHARKHWIGLGISQMPTVRVQYDDSSLKRMMKAGYIPPLRLGVDYALPALLPYVPLGTNGHRAAINGTGAYAGRGMWGNPDALLVGGLQSSGSAAEKAWRCARCAAQAGLAVFFHVFDHRSTSGVNGGTDAPNRLIPQSFRKAATLSLNQSYSGLGAHCVYSNGPVEESSGLTLLGAAGSVSGGTGSFSSYDPSHAVNYSGPMAFLEGEAYLGDAAMSALRRACTNYNFNRLGHDRGPYYYNYATRRAQQGIPNTTGSGYGTTLDMSVQERAPGWTVNLLAQAYALRADDHPEQPFIKNLVRNVDRFLSDSFGYYPTGTGTQYERGGSYIGFANYSTSPWMLHWQGMSAYQMQRLADFLPENARGMTGLEESAFLSARLALRQMKAYPYAAGTYRMIHSTDADGLSPLPLDEWPDIRTATISGGTWAATPPYGMAWTNGDKIRVPPKNASFVTQTMPTNVTAATLYYMINVSGSTFQVATSEGGEPIAAGDHAGLAFGVTPAAYLQTPLSHSYYWPNDDSYELITMALCEQAIGEKHMDLRTDDIVQIRSFFAPKVQEISRYAAWNYDGDNII